MAPNIEFIRAGTWADPLIPKDEACVSGKVGDVKDVNPAMADFLVNGIPGNPAAKYTQADPPEGDGDVESTGPVSKPEKTTKSTKGSKKTGSKRS